MHFITSYKPSLKIGTYTVKVEQSINLDGTEMEKGLESTQEIAITGDRFILNPHNVKMLYPAENSRHNFSDTLAHIVLDNAFYPWERKVATSDEDTPYLALLLFHENEAFSTDIMSLKNLKSKIHLKDEQLDVSDKLDDKITVIEVEKELLQKLVPNADELKLLTHVQKPDAQKSDTMRSVLMANRLPFKGGTTTACLVSLENRFSNGSFNFDAKDDLVTLVLLKQWSFTDIVFYSSKKINTDGIKINKDVEDVQKKLNQVVKRTYRGKANFLDGIKSFLDQLKKCSDSEEFNKYKASLLTKSIDHSPVFTRLLNELTIKNLAMPLFDDSDDRSKANRFFEKAMVPLRHHVRTGETTVSWYRGPLLGGKQDNNAYKNIFPVEVADELLLFDKDYQMFDVSYA